MDLFVRHYLATRMPVCTRVVHDGWRSPPLAHDPQRTISVVLLGGAAPGDRTRYGAVTPPSGCPSTGGHAASSGDRDEEDEDELEDGDPDPPPLYEEFAPSVSSAPADPSAPVVDAAPPSATKKRFLVLLVIRASRKKWLILAFLLRYIAKARAFGEAFARARWGARIGELPLEVIPIFLDGVSWSIPATGPSRPTCRPVIGPLTSCA